MLLLTKQLRTSTHLRPVTRALERLATVLHAARTHVYSLCLAFLTTATSSSTLASANVEDTGRRRLYT